MIGLKVHIGIFFIILVINYLGYFFNWNRMGEYESSIPAAAACIMFFAVEVVGWVLYWCFFT